MLVTTALTKPHISVRNGWYICRLGYRKGGKFYRSAEKAGFGRAKSAKAAYNAWKRCVEWYKKGCPGRPGMARYGR